MSWLTDVKQFVKDVWTDFTEFLLDLPKIVLQGFLDGVFFVIDAIPSPDFLTTYTVGSAIPADLGWLLNQIGFGEALTIVLAAYTFYFLRRVLTLGIW